MFRRLNPEVTDFIENSLFAGAQPTLIRKRAFVQFGKDIPAISLFRICVKKFLVNNLNHLDNGQSLIYRCEISSSSLLIFLFCVTSPCLCCPG